MKTRNSIGLIKKELIIVQNLFNTVIKIIPKFDITNPKILPYGLKPHTRSVSWVVEQVIVQQAKYNAKKLKLKDVSIDMPDTCLHDCVVEANNQKFYVNIKITNTENKPNKNDIAAVEKLYMQYTANPEYRLIYAVFGFTFNNTRITFEEDFVHTFSPQFLPIYVNPRNDKIQAYYKAKPVYRSRKKFLNLLKTNSKSIALT